MIKIYDDGTVQFGIMKLNYYDDDFFEEFVLYYSEDSVVEIKESFNKNNKEFSGMIKVLLIDEVVTVVNLEDKSIKQVLEEILEELQVEEEIG